MYKLEPPGSFNFVNPTWWGRWRQRFLRFRTASKLNEENDDTQISVLIYTMGSEAESIWNTFVFEDGEEINFLRVIEKFDSYFCPNKNIIYERAKFHRRCQREGENIETFVRSLYELAENCEYKDKSQQIRDRLVIGVKSPEISQKLQLIPNLNLEKAIQIARCEEMVTDQMKSLQKQTQCSRKIIHVDEIKRRTQNNSQRNNTPKEYFLGSIQREESDESQEEKEKED